MRALHSLASGSTCASTIKWSRSRGNGIAAYGCFSCPTSMSRTLILSDAAEIAAARPYPERADREAGWHDQVAEFLYAATIAPVRGRLQNCARRLGACGDV